MANVGFTNDDFLNLIIIYGECNRIVERTCRVFAERYPNRPNATGDIVRRLLKNCRQFGQFKTKINKNKPLVDNDINEINVLGYFTASPNASIRDCERDLTLSTRTIHRILKKHKWKPFSYHLVQHLQLGDLPRRVEFCEWFLMKTQEDENFIKKVIWCDEAKFSKNGLFNRHNSHFWSNENPHVSRERYFQDRWSFNVFCAIKDDKILALKFYDENLNGERYCHILEEAIRPALHTLRNGEAASAWYQQDGAPPHNFGPVAQHLYDMFDDRWIANQGPFRWPARSPDLAPLDFGIWGYIKNQVFSKPVTTKEDMMQRVLLAFNSLTPDHISRITRHNLMKRIHKCLEVDGANFEHLL